MRTKTGFVRRRRANRLHRAAKGYRGSRRTLLRVVKETVRRAWWYSRTDRRAKKRDLRRLWIARINAAARMRGINYSRFMAGLKRANVELNRKVLANLALTDEHAFDQLVGLAREAL